MTDASRPDVAIPLYRAYAFHHINQLYSGVDYSKLKRGRAEYAAVPEGTAQGRSRGIRIEEMNDEPNNLGGAQQWIVS